MPTVFNNSSNGTSKKSVPESPPFAKGPYLSLSVRQTIVSIAPWVALIGGIEGSFWLFVLILPAFTFGSFSGGVTFLILQAIKPGLFFLAIKPLIARKKMGWNLFFWAAMVKAVPTVIAMTTSVGGSFAVGTIVCAVIAFWLLIEVRDLYVA
ncbi:MAG: hypothetical protein PHZ00_06090 [Candidatus Peribacteraceae bacterium]|nr:hypothetical protein [Candidatus Peribacteraceae bacterium]